MKRFLIVAVLAVFGTATFTDTADAFGRRKKKKGGDCDSCPVAAPAEPTCGGCDAPPVAPACGGCDGGAVAPAPAPAPVPMPPKPAPAPVPAPAPMKT